MNKMESIWIKHGHGFWTYIDEQGNRAGWVPDYECGNCGARAFKYPYNYCPTCGRKMINGMDTDKWESIPDVDGGSYDI